MAGETALDPLITRSVRSGVAQLVLDRPEQRNALTTDLLRQLCAELDAAVRDGVGAVVLTGAPPAFCSGADLDEFAADAPDELRLERIRLVGETMRRLMTLEVPHVAAVERAAVGAGWGLALACDVCLATAGARFSLPEVAKGFRIPETLMRRLVAVVGPTRAAQLAYTGEPQTAEDGLAAGFVARVAADRAELLRAAQALAASLASRPPASIAIVKRALAESLEQEDRT